MAIPGELTYEQLQESLLGETARLGGLAEAQVADAISAVMRRDSALAEAVIQRDLKLDAAQKTLERAAAELLSLRRPTAKDLREVLSAWKVASDLERVGDLAKGIAKRTLALNQTEPVPLARSLERMGRMAGAHLKQVLDAYAARNVEPAIAVWFQDEDVDAHYNALFRELVSHMVTDPRAIGPCAHLLFIAKNIERIGDHSTNIAETVHYLVTGEDITTERPKADEAERASDL